MRALALLALVAACTPATSTSINATPTPTNSTPIPTSDVDPLVGKPAPDFTATAQDGSAVHLAALRGKPVILYFYPKD